MRKEHQASAASLDRLDHLVRFIERDRHRLFQDHMDAGFGGSDGMLGVDRIGRGDPDGVYFAALAHSRDAGKRLDLGMVFVERVQCVFAQVGYSRELNVLGALQIRNDAPAFIANAGYPEPQRLRHALLPICPALLNTQSGLASRLGLSHSVVLKRRSANCPRPRSQR